MNLKPGEAAELARMLNEQLPDDFRATAHKMQGAHCVVVMYDAAGVAAVEARRVRVLSHHRSGPHEGRGWRQGVVDSVVEGLQNSIFADYWEL